VELSSITRRQVFMVGAAVMVGPAGATPQSMAAAIQAFVGEGVAREGRVELDVAPLVENGNTVPLTVSVQSPMTATDHVVALAVFNERNPQPDVVQFLLGPLAGRAVVSTRIRLATSQQLIALARMNDGSVWSHRIDVVVTLAACIE